METEHRCLNVYCLAVQAPSDTRHTWPGACAPGAPAPAAPARTAGRARRRRCLIWLRRRARRAGRHGASRPLLRSRSARAAPVLARTGRGRTRTAVLAMQHHNAVINNPCCPSQHLSSRIGTPPAKGQRSTPCVHACNGPAGTFKEGWRPGDCCSAMSPPLTLGSMQQVCGLFPGRTVRGRTVFSSREEGVPGADGLRGAH